MKEQYWTCTKGKRFEKQRTDPFESHGCGPMEWIQPAPSPHLTLLVCLGRVRIPWAFRIPTDESMTEPTQTTAEAQRSQGRNGYLFGIHGPIEERQLASRAAF